MKRITNLRLKLIGFAAFGLLALAFFYFDIGCVFRALFGIPCPGCGMTRAVFSLLSLDLAAAFTYHPLVFSLPIIALYILFDGRLFNNRRLDTAVLVILGLLFISVYFARMLDPVQREILLS